MQKYTCSVALESHAQHTGFVKYCSFSPDGKRILTQSLDSTAKVWDAQTGEHVFTASVWEQADQLCCFSPCGQLLVSSSADSKELHLRSANDGSTVASCRDGRYMNAACFSPDGAQLAVGGINGPVRIFSVPQLQLTATLQCDKGYVSCRSLAFTRDGLSVIVAFGTCWIELWDVATAQKRLTFDDSIYVRSAVALSPDGKHVAFADSANACVWDVASGTRKLKLAAPKGTDGVVPAIQSVSWLPSGEVLVSGHGDGLVRFWSFSSADPSSSGQLLGSIDIFGGRQPGDVILADCCISPCGSAFACCGGDEGQEEDEEEGLDSRPSSAFLKVFRTHEPTPLQLQLGELLRSKRGADVTLACSGGGAEMQAHSLILALRSGTLQRQLDWGAEREGGAGGSAAAGARQLEIDGSVQPAILERLLEYIYTDHLEIQSAEEAQHLLHAASFYDVPGLFQLCLSALEERLAVGNVADTLILADRIGARAAGLKLAALRFVKDKENTAAVMRTAAWRRRVPIGLVNEALLYCQIGEHELPPEEEEPEAEAAGGKGGGVVAGGEATGGAGSSAAEQGAPGGGAAQEASGAAAGGGGAGRNVRQRTA